MQRFSGREYLMIDVAGSFGLDKKTWQERLDWFEEHKEHLMEMLPQAEEPALYYAGVKAWFDVLAGKAIGYAISLDATSSGLQLLSALTCDMRASLLCNVTNQDGDVRADAYTLVYDAMLKAIGENSKIDRKDVKQAIMTALYGSQAVPKEVFGEGELLAIFYDVMKQFAPAAWELNETFIEIWDSEAVSNDWVLPDNFHVHVKVMTLASDTVNFLNEPFEITRKINAPTKEGRSLAANCTHSLDGMIVREITRRCDYDPKMVSNVIRLLENENDFNEIGNSVDNKMVATLWAHYLESGYLSARILEHLNEGNIWTVEPGPIWILLGSLPKKPFKLMTIHQWWM